MDITRIVRVGYGYYPNPSRIKKKKKTKPLSSSLTLSLPLLSPRRHSLSLFQSSPVSAFPHCHSLSLFTVLVKDDDFYSGNEDDDENGETTNAFAFDSDDDADVADYEFIDNDSDYSDDVVSHRYQVAIM